MTTTVAVARERNARFIGRPMIGGGCARPLGILRPCLLRPRLRCSNPSSRGSTRSWKGSWPLGARRPWRSSRAPRSPSRRSSDSCMRAGSACGPPSRTGGIAPPAARMCPEIWRAAAAVELLHTMALLHDDVMDDDDERRGAPTARARQTGAARAREQADPGRVGDAVAIVAGDLAAAFAEQLLATAGFPADRQAAACGAPGHGCGSSSRWAPTSRLANRRRRSPATVAYLKGGAYTVEGPLLFGAALAADVPRVDEALRALRSAARHRLPAAGRPRRRRRARRRLAGPGRRPGCGVRGGARRPPAGPDRRRRARHARRAGGSTRAGGV